jgi:tRNA pseudouridine32 synthase/23S rRNA pseudouridine746 synthase
VIHYFPEDYIFEEPSEFTDPFRYIPHPAVKTAARLVCERIDGCPQLSSWFAEGKMLGVLVCRHETEPQSTCFLAAFSGNVGGRSLIDGFVPPIYDLTDPDGEFKIREAEISELNSKIDELLDSDRLLCLERELADASRGRDMELDALKGTMAVSKARREQIRKGCTDDKVLDGLIRESQQEKAEFRRLKKVLDGVISDIQDRIALFHNEIKSLKKQRASMSENLQNWIFRQYIVHNASGEKASIAEIFGQLGITPPGGTGECAAPKLLEYAYRNGLKPLAMGEFWYGKASGTAVRVHGHFYPSCTSKCGPLLGYMMNGLTLGRSNQSTGIEYNILFDDTDIIVAEKPSGMPSVPGLDGRVSLQELLEQSYGQTIHAVHRLDMDTSGVILFAKTPEAGVELRKQFEDHTIRKCYKARLAPATSVHFSTHISLPLAADYDERPRQKVDFKQGKPALTEYEIVSENADGTMDVLFHPTTGRTHQLRVHSAHALGLSRPIVGDLLYGGYSISDTDFIPRRLHLHALSITFRHPRTGEELTFTSDRLSY